VVSESVALSAAENDHTVSQPLIVILPKKLFKLISKQCVTSALLHSANGDTTDQGAELIRHLCELWSSRVAANQSSILAGTDTRAISEESACCNGYFPARSSESAEKYVVARFLALAITRKVSLNIQIAWKAKHSSVQIANYVAATVMSRIETIAVADGERALSQKNVRSGNRAVTPKSNKNRLSIGVVHRWVLALCHTNDVHFENELAITEIPNATRKSRHRKCETQKQRQS